MRKDTLTLGQTFILYDMGVRKIEVRYSGGGDSGAIDEVIFLNEEEDDITEFVKDKLDALDVELSVDCIENVAYAQILNHHISDWYNNGGGAGNLYIEIPSLKAYGTTEYYEESEGVYDEETNSWEYPDDDERNRWEEDFEENLETNF
jgi:hypothetical protein